MDAIISTLAMEQEDNKGSELNAHDTAVNDRRIRLSEGIRRLANLRKPAPPHRDPSKASSDVQYVIMENSKMQDYAYFIHFQS
jgi:hypothetical protein